MDFEPNEEQHQLLRSIRGFMQSEVEPLIAEHERAKTFPHDLLPRLTEFGYFGGWLPESLGGMGIDNITWAMMMEELGYTWPSLRTIVNITNAPIDKLARTGSDELKTRYLTPLLAGEAKIFNGLTEPDVGSDVSSVRFRADLDGDHWVLSGTKMWITGGAFADWGTVVARTFSPTCDGALSMFLVDRRESAFEVRAIDTMVLRSTGTAELTFDKVRIPRGNLIGTEGDALRSTLAGLAGARINIAMGAVGAAQKAYDLSVEYVKGRKQFGKSIASFQLVQQHIVQMRMKIDAARSLSYMAAAAMDNGRPATLEASLAKLYASEVAHEVASAAMQVHGAIGYSTEYPIERIFRDTRGSSIPEGTTEIQTLIAGREILGVSAIR